MLIQAAGLGVRNAWWGVPVIERLTRAFVVVVIDVAGDFRTSFLNVLERVSQAYSSLKQRLNRSQRPFSWGV
jgi:hypothetical protein